MTLSLANSVEDVEAGCSGCNTQSDSDSESSNSFRFTDIKDVKLMTGAPATTSTSIVFKDSPHPTVGDIFNIHIETAKIDGKEFKNFTNLNNQIPCEHNGRISLWNGISRQARLYTILCLVAFFLLIAVPFLRRSAITPNPPSSNSPSKDKMVKRAVWGAMEKRKNMSQMNNGITKIFLTHTEGHSCFSFAVCLRELRRIQQEDMNKYHLPDIRYNFFIGGDERVYEGNVTAEKPTHRTFLKTFRFLKCSLIIEKLSDTKLVIPTDLEWVRDEVNFCNMLEFDINNIKECVSQYDISFEC